MNKDNLNIGLYFGSFNPVHVGHLALANYIVENTHLDYIWFVVSPQNPFKKNSDLAKAEYRLKMLKDSVKGYDRFVVCDIELQLPTPSYTYLTLRELSNRYSHNFTIIMGADNLPYLERWKNASEIIANHSFIVYPRPGYNIKDEYIIGNTTIIDAPVFNIDSSTIRKDISEGKNYRFLIPKEAYLFIQENNLYQCYKP